jgi:WD40 repeat protein
VLTVQLGHSGPVYGAAFSPDPHGRFVVTASQDNHLILWNSETGMELRRFDGHTFNVNGAWFSPDGRRILSVSGDRTARTWDVETGASWSA